MVKVGSFDVSRSRYEIELEADGYYSIQSMSSGRYIDVGSHLSSEGAKIVNYYNYNDGDGTKWIIDRLPNGEYTFSAKCGNGKFLCIDPATNELIQSSSDTYNEWNLLYDAGTNLGRIVSWIAYNYENTPATPMDCIGMWIFNPKIYIDISGDPGFSQLQLCVQNAVNIWNEAISGDMVITIVNEKALANIIFSAETEVSYEQKRGEWPESDNGPLLAFADPNCAATYCADYYERDSNSELIKYTKEIQVITAAEIYIRRDLINPDSIQRTVIHELGHALGYLGHSKNEHSIMYSGEAQSNPNILIEDKLYLNQIQGKQLR